MNRNAAIVGFLFALISTVLLILGATSAGNVLEPAGWLFLLGSGLPYWMSALVLACAVAVFFLFSRQPHLLAMAGDSSARLTIFFLLLSVLFIAVAGIRSTLFADGNLLVGQIRQLPHLPVGMTWQVDQLLLLLTRVINRAGLRDDQSAFWGARIFSVVCAFVTLPALSRLYARGKVAPVFRVGAMAIALLPVLPFAVGLAAREAVLLPIIGWILALATARRVNFRERLLILLLLTLGCWLHPWALTLVPVGIVAVLPLAERVRLGAGVILTLALVAVLYAIRTAHLPLLLSLQRLSAPTALGGEWILSSEHLLTLAAMVLLLLPCLLLVLLLPKRESEESADAALLALASLGSFAAVLCLRLPGTLVLSWPRLLPFFLPVSLWLGMQFTRVDERKIPVIGIAAFPLAVLTLALVWLLPMSRTRLAEDYVTRLGDKLESRWVAGGLGLRDAYFLEQHYEEATYWENQLKIRSSDYLTWRGCYDLMGNGENSAAVQELNQVVISQPDWGDPRSMLALAYAKTGEFPAARAQLDTTLAQFPYDQQLLISRYSIELQANQVAAADSMAQIVRRLYPAQPTVMTDQMIIAGRLGRVREAIARADSLLAINPKHAAAMRVRGMAAEREGKLKDAIDWYQKYIENETDMSQIATIRSRISQLSGSVPDSSRQP